MDMNKLWMILIVASLILMTMNHPILMAVVAVGVWIYYKNPWGLKMRIINTAKKVAGLFKKKPKAPNRRPRV